MRGHDEQTGHMFSYLSPEQRVPADHPLRAVRALTDEALRSLSPRFARMYAKTGRPSIPPEQLLRALMLQVLYTVRSERLLMEELNDNLLFRWFVGLNMDDPVWHPTTFSKNRDRLLAGDVAAAFFDAVQGHARAAGLLSDEHFTIDGSQLDAWASLTSFQPKEAAAPPSPDAGKNPTVNFHGRRRRNDTHQSTTDPDAMLYRKGPGREARLACLGHMLLDNRHGLVTNVCVTAAALLLEASAPRGSTVGADKGYDVASFVQRVRARGITPPHRGQGEVWGDRRAHDAARRLSGQSANTEAGRTSVWMDENGRRVAAAAASRRRAGGLGRDLRRSRVLTWCASATWRRRVPNRRSFRRWRSPFRADTHRGHPRRASCPTIELMRVVTWRGFSAPC